MERVATFIKEERYDPGVNLDEEEAIPNNQLYGFTGDCEGDLEERVFNDTGAGLNCTSRSGGAQVTGKCDGTGKGKFKRGQVHIGGETELVESRREYECSQVLNLCKPCAASKWCPVHGRNCKKKD